MIFFIKLFLFYVISVKKPKQTTKENNDTQTVVRRVPAPPPSDYYRCPSSLDSDFNSYTSSVSSDFSHMLSNDSSLAMPYMGDVRNSMIGVLRVNYGNGQYVSDISSDSSSSMLNDLSSVDTSVVTSVPSMLSFKNI